MKPDANSSINVHRFDNGLVLVAEPMRWLESVAFSFLVPAGCSSDPPERAGLAGFTCDMVLRGAGDRDDRTLVEALENLGVERHESVSNAHTSFSGATLKENLDPALEIYADILRHPRLPENKLEAARMVVVQELRAIDDEPSQRTMLELRRHHYPDPYGRSSLGELAHVKAVGHGDVLGFYSANYRPNETILGVAGNFDWSRLKNRVGELLGDWSNDNSTKLAIGSRPSRLTHIDHDSNQTQIGIAYDSVPYSHPDYFQAWGAVGVLSGGMSSRLFTEVREKRGLCYSVHASQHTLRDRGSVLCYAGTSADRAQETLDVTLHELKRLAYGVEAGELDRLKARIKSGLIMQQESSGSRSGSIARDWYHLGRCRSLEEIGRLVDALSCDSINEYLAANPPRDFTIVTLGPKPLTIPIE